VRRAALVLLALLAVAGCSRPAEPERDARVAPFVQGGWPTVFGDAPATATLLNRMGFRLSPYAAAGAAHRAASVPTALSDPAHPPVNMANLVLTGDAARLSALTFSLDVVNLETSPFSKEQFVRWVLRPMSSLGLDGQAPVRTAIETESPITAHLQGADLAFSRDPIPGGRRLVVTFTPSAAKAGTAPQGSK
jgi:hypothetical protein